MRYDFISQKYQISIHQHISASKIKPVNRYSLSKSQLIFFISSCGSKLKTPLPCLTPKKPLQRPTKGTVLIHSHSEWLSILDSNAWNVAGKWLQRDPVPELPDTSSCRPSLDLIVHLSCQRIVHGVDWAINLQTNLRLEISLQKSSKNSNPLWLRAVSEGNITFRVGTEENIFASGKGFGQLSPVLQSLPAAHTSSLPRHPARTAVARSD